jgi:hypothetical protein
VSVTVVVTGMLVLVDRLLDHRGLDGVLLVWRWC